ncbi:hypothetical protein MRX96_042224 [Rhipicephalus microplus]
MPWLTRGCSGGSWIWPPREGDVPGCAYPFGGGHLLLLLTGGIPFLDVWSGGPADPGGIGCPGWPWQPPDAGRWSVRVNRSFLCLALRLPPVACPARSSSPADNVIGPRSPSSPHCRCYPPPGPPGPARPCCCRPVLLPAGPADMDSARRSSARGCCARRRHASAPSGSPAPPPPRRPRRGTPDSPAVGPSSPAFTASSSSGLAGSEAPASSCPTVLVQPRQPILDGDVLWVYLPAPEVLQCPVGDYSMKYSGAIWTCRVQSVRRSVEFEHSVRVNDRIYVCSVRDSTLMSRPSYHRCLATATLVPSTETPRCRCGVCDATVTTKRGLANHLRCHVDQAGPSGAARERAPARRVHHVSTSSSDTSTSSSGFSSPPAAPRASRRLRGLSPSDAAPSMWLSSSPAARSGASSPASIGEPSAFDYTSSSSSSTSVGSASVRGLPAPSPAASPVPSKQPLRDAGGTSTPTPHTLS